MQDHEPQATIDDALSRLHLASKTYTEMRWRVKIGAVCARNAIHM